MEKKEFNIFWCKQLADHLAEGLSFESFAGKIDVTQGELQEYLKNNPDFRRAYEVGMERNRLWWEKQSVNALKSEFNPNVWQYNMINRFGWDSKPKDTMIDKIEVTLVGRMREVRDLNEELLKKNPDEIEKILNERHVERIVEKKKRTDAKLKNIKENAKIKQRANILHKVNPKVQTYEFTPEELQEKLNAN